MQSPTLSGSKCTSSIFSLQGASFQVSASRELHQASGSEVIKSTAEKFAQQPELHRTGLAQRRMDLNDCYKAAHQTFPGLRGR
eukprot:1871631-Amphidinium_carterae.1